MGVRRSLGETSSRHPVTAGLFVGLAVATILGGGGIALAAIPSTSTGTYTGCVVRQTGAIRVIDRQDGERCTRREKTIAWSKGWRYRGVWSTSAQYKVGDVALAGGATYLARRSSTGATPSTSTAAWRILAQAPPFRYSFDFQHIQPGQHVDVKTHCPEDWSLTGGGVSTPSGNLAVTVHTSAPIDDESDPDLFPNNGWLAHVNNGSGAAVTANVYAICTSSGQSLGWG